jgi:hypothetical protein
MYGVAEVLLSRCWANEPGRHRQTIPPKIGGREHTPSRTLDFSSVFCTFVSYAAYMTNFVCSDGLKRREVRLRNMRNIRIAKNRQLYRFYLQIVLSIVYNGRGGGRVITILQMSKCSPMSPTPAPPVYELASLRGIDAVM